MTSRQPRISPGPSWAVLSEPPTSSPSTRTSIRSDYDLDLDVDMGDDEAEHDPDAIRAPISKRKAPADDSPSARKQHKVPRLDGNAARRRPPPSSPSPRPSSSTQHVFKVPAVPDRPRANGGESAGSGTSTSDFPDTLSQRVQALIARDRQKEKERARQQNGTARRGPPATARKHTTQVKNIRKVTTANLLRDVQKSNDPRDESAAWTRIRRKGKPKRTTYGEEMAQVRPLDAARQRGGDVIELTDSSDSTRRVRLSSPSTSNGPRPSVSANKDDPIIITSGSEDDRTQTIRSSQRRRSGTGANRRGVPPPAEVEVISISDSDEDVGTSAVASSPPGPSTAQTSTPQINPPLPPPQNVPATSTAPNTNTTPTTPIAPITPASTQAALPSNNSQRSSPSYGPPPDDFDDAFGNIDFDTTGGDANPSGAFDGWDNLDVGPPLASLPAAIPSDPAATAGAGTTAVSVPARTVEELTPDALFQSYVNMDQLGGDMDQGPSGDATPEGGNEAEESGVVEDGVTNGPVASTREDRQNADGDVDAGMRNLEEGEVDPNDVAPPRSPAPRIMEEGEILSQEVRKENQPPIQPVPVLAPRALPSTLVHTHSSASASPCSSTSGNNASQPLERRRTWAIPDISSYRVRFKRTQPEAGGNSFFSRVLNGAARSVQMVESAGQRNEQKVAEGSASTPAEVPSDVGEVQNQHGDADMQDATAVSVPEPITPAEDVVSTQPTFRPGPLLQPRVDPDRPNTSSTVAPSTTANDNPPASTQPTTPSTPVMSAQPPAATQPLARTSSRPSIMPPRIPRPSTPMSLVEALNEVRREKLERDGLVRRRSAGNVTARNTTSSQTTSRVSSPASAPAPSPSPSPSPPPPASSSRAPPSTPAAAPSTSASQPNRTFERTPSLNGIRELWRRHAGASQSPRPASTAPVTTTSASTSASHEEGDDHAPVETSSVTVATPVPVRVPATIQVQVPMSMNTENRTPVEPVETHAPVPVPVSMQGASSTDKDRHTPVEAVPITISKPAPTSSSRQALPPTTSKDVMAGPSSSSARPVATKSVAWSTSTPTSTTRASTLESSTSSGTHAKRRKTLACMPFQAFISPVRSPERVKGKGKGKEKEKEAEVQTGIDKVQGTSTYKGKGKEKARAQARAGPDADPFVSPTVFRPRVSLGGTGLLGQQKKHARRESASAAFEAYIVRESPRQGSKEGMRSVRPRLLPPGQPDFVESALEAGVASLSVSSPVISNVVPAVVSTPGRDGDGDGRADDVNAMDITVENEMEVDKQAEDVDVDVRNIHVDPTRIRGQGETGTREAVAHEVDEADTLLELASVHLSQPEGAEEEVPESRMKEADKKVMGELAEAGTKTGVVEEPAQEVGSEMVVDGPSEDLEMPDDPPSPPVHQETDRSEPPAKDVIAPALANDVANTRTAVPGEDVVQDHPVQGTSRAATPELIHPEDPLIAPPSRDSDYDNEHTRGLSGGAGSVEVCEALLKSPGGDGSEPANVAIDSLVSSRTVSSTSLAPPRVRPRSSWSGSKRKSPSKEASSVDLLRRPLPQSNGASTSKSRSGPESAPGYRVVTWPSYVAEQRRRPPEYKRARDLPHSLQDYMNMLPETFRNSDIARRIFEAHIQEAMANEPDAPLIEVFDNDIGDEVTPQWEFHYTNDIWYADGVPPPDVKNLKSCGCVGRCDPKSGKCACAKRQLRWVQPYIDGEIIPPTWPGSPFVYDNKGMLQRFECPIFECNQFCDCDDDCPNRVVQNGRKWPVHIVKTKHKGWGVSAGNKRIPKGSYIGIYAGELLTEQEGEQRGRYYDMYGRTYLFSVDFHHLKMGMDDPDEWENLYVVDAYHAGNFTRFLNHSCDPNCKIFACYTDDADVNKPLLAVFTTRDVEPWEELCFSYYGDMDEKREEIEEAREAGLELVRENAVYAQCRCDSDNCIGRLFG